MRRWGCSTWGIIWKLFKRKHWGSLLLPWAGKAWTLAGLESFLGCPHNPVVQRTCVEINFLHPSHCVLDHLESSHKLLTPTAVKCWGEERSLHVLAIQRYKTWSALLMVMPHYGSVAEAPGLSGSTWTCVSMYAPAGDSCNSRKLIQHLRVIIDVVFRDCSCS